MQQQNYIQPQIIQEEDIDLKDLFRTIWGRKVFIAIFTIIITASATIYTFFIDKPIYEAKAILDIGYITKYQNSADGYVAAREPLENVGRLSKELEIIYIDLAKMQKNNPEISGFASIKSIVPINGHDSFLEITVNASNNKIATDKINEILEYINKKDKIKIDNELQAMAGKLKLIDEQIKIIEKNQATIPNNAKSEIENSVEAMEKIEALSKRHPGKINLNIDSETLELFNGSKLEYIELMRLKEQRDNLQKSISQDGFKNTEIVGQIILNDYPIKPNKKLFVTVSFISSFILAIFLVFFMEFVKGFKEEEDKNSSKIS